jgi:chromosome segregation ATPase
MSTIEQQLAFIVTAIKELRDGQDKMQAQLNSLEAKVNSLEAKVNSLEARFDSLEAKVISLEARFDSLEAKVNSLEARFDSLEAKVEKGFADLHVDFKHDIANLRVQLSQEYREMATALEQGSA